MTFPPPFDRAAADRLRAAFPDPVEGDLADLLACLGGNSPYLADLALREPATLGNILAAGPDAMCQAALRSLVALPATRSRAEIAAALRTAKRHVALAASVADIGNGWTLGQVTGALSDLAEHALRLATAHLLRAAHDRGELCLSHPAAPARGAGFTVLAMGKLGARELNFSSDVDLILVFDPERHPYNAERLGAIFTRLARDLVALMQQRDAGGYVFRTDLRLRPDPASTPPAIALPTALAYYEGAAHTWERAAMIKARPVAGDLALGRRFLDAIRPFVWRRHLDFAAIADIRAMKRRMDQHTGAALPPDGPAETRLLGHDVKLGQGGIREIEFCAQTLQLVWGGRNPALRAPATLAALRAAGQAGHLPAAEVTTLSAAYDALRRIEHRLQMVADRQTHSLPDSPAGLSAFATFLGARSAADFARDLLGHLDRVHGMFANVLSGRGDPPDLYDPDLHTPKPAAMASAPSGRNPDPVWEGWLAGGPRALRTERARALMAELLPPLTAVVDRQPHPATVWARLDEFFHRLPSGVQILSMLRHNPALLDRLGDVLGAAPWLADHLAGTPAAIEGLMAPQAIDPDPDASLAAQLHDARALDEALSIASRFVRGEEFRLAVAELDGRIDQDQAGTARTALAEAAIGRLLPLVMADHARRYGRVRGGGMVVVALGKAGSREMMAGSDLDLMLIYDQPDEDAESDGPARLPASQYFARAAQAVIAALTVPTQNGKLYEVDMRLRPSGGKGPVAVSLAAFTRYHRESAWTWERLALTRARVVAGPARLRARVSRAVGEALAWGDRGKEGQGALPPGPPPKASLWNPLLRGEERGPPVSTPPNESAPSLLPLTQGSKDLSLAGSPLAKNGGRAPGLSLPRSDQAGILADTRAMRRRVAEELPARGPWDAKLRPGGLLEVEFIAQALQLVHAGRPRVLHPCTRVALARLGAAGCLPRDEAARLVQADRLWRAVQGLLRITGGRIVPPVLPDAVVPRMERLLDRLVPGEPAPLLVRLDRVAAGVRASFVRHVGGA